MLQSEAERVLEGWWGWHGGGRDEEFRAPLPPTEAFPTMRRAPGVDSPPYLVARRFGPSAGLRLAEVMLCAGDGVRAGYKRGDTSQCLYVGGEHVPEEWKQPIVEALDEVGKHWPGVQLTFRPDPDSDPLEPSNG